MKTELTPIDISGVPELVRLAQEVRKTKTPRLLRQHEEDVAVLMPVSAAPKRRHRRAKTEADYQAFLASAGGWKDLVATEQLKQDIAESRRISSRPPVAL